MPTTEPISSFYIQRAANGGWIISVDSDVPSLIASTDKEMVEMIAGFLRTQPPNLVSRVGQWIGQLRPVATTGS